MFLVQCHLDIPLDQRDLIWLTLNECFLNVSCQLKGNIVQGCWGWNCGIDNKSGISVVSTIGDVTNVVCDLSGDLFQGGGCNTSIVTSHRSGVSDSVFRAVGYKSNTLCDLSGGITWGREWGATTAGHSRGLGDISVNRVGHIGAPCKCDGVSAQWECVMIGGRGKGCYWTGDKYTCNKQTSKLMGQGRRYLTIWWEFWILFQNKDCLSSDHDSHYEDKAVVNSSYFNNENSYTGKMAPLYSTAPCIFGLTTYTQLKDEHIIHKHTDKCHAV